MRSCLFILGAFILFAPDVSAQQRHARGERHHVGSGRSKPRRAAPNRFLARYDRNHDGKVTRTELRNRRLFARHDRNRDGVIDSRDFRPARKTPRAGKAVRHRETGKAVRRRGSPNGRRGLRR